MNPTPTNSLNRSTSSTSSPSGCGGYTLMVCSVGNANMATFARLQAIGSASQSLKAEEVCHQKLATKCSGRDFRDVDEENLLDEEDMDIYGLRPITDPLDLVCCNTCKKPIKASQYSSHAERCKSVYSTITPETNVPAPRKKPQRKARKKLINHANQATSCRDLKKDETIDNGKINASASSTKRQIKKIRQAEGNPKPNGTHVMNDKRVGSDNMECSLATLQPSKPFKRCRVAAGSPTNLVNDCMRVTEPKVFTHVPKPMATKIYYSQSNKDLRRAICHMFYEEPNKDYGQNASQVELERDALPIQNLSPGTPYDEHAINPQAVINIVHRDTIPDRGLAPSSEVGGYVSSINSASQIPVNNNVGPHCM